MLNGLYIDRRPGALVRLCGELGYEERTIYKIKDRALRRYVNAMFGVADG